MSTQSFHYVPETPWRFMSVPALPAVAIKALQLLSDEETRLLELYRVIESDPGFASEVLRIANSPLYAPSKPITSLTQAAMLLGFDKLRGAAVTIGIRSYLGNMLSVPSMQACWRHSLACAMIGERLAQSLSIRPDDVFTAGTMHDIGRFVLAAIHPKNYPDFLGKATLDPGEALQEEAKLFGMDHCRIGGLLVENWDLPKELVEIAGQHHAPDRPFVGDVPSVTRCACQFADALGFQAVRRRNAPTYQDLLSGIPEEYRDKFVFDLAEMTFSIETKVRSLAAV